MKKHTDLKAPLLRRVGTALNARPLLRLGLYALAAAAAGFLLAAMTLFSGPVPVAVALAAALPFSLAAVSAYAGAAVGYVYFWGTAGAAEPVAAGFLILAASCLFHDLLVATRKWFMPLCAAGIYAMTGLIFLLSAPVRLQAAALYGARISLLCACSYLFSGALEKKPEGLYASGFCMLAATSQLLLLPELPLSIPLAGAIVFLFSSAPQALPVAAGCGLAVAVTFRPDYSVTAIFCLAAAACRYIHPKSPLLRAPVYFAACILGALLLGAWDSLFLPGVFLGLMMALPLWRPMQALLAQDGSQSAAQRQKALSLASSALWDIACNLQRGAASGLEPQSAAIFDCAADQICRTCAKWSVCWEQNAQETFRLLSRASRGILRRGEAKRDDLPPLFLARCCHIDSFLRAVNDALSTQLAKVQYQSRLAESRRIVCDQYRILSRLLQLLCEPAQPQLQPDCYSPELGFRATGLRGASISGDYGASFRCGEWYYLLLCDGMGTGEEARAEALATSALIQELIEAGVDAHDALQTLNGLYILRDGGGFAAIDLLQVSLVSAEGFLHKWGAAPSFLKFGRVVQKLGSALPPPGLGVGQGYKPECIRISLQRGEALVLTSDGVDPDMTERFLQSSGELNVRELASGVVGSSDTAAPDDRTAAVLRLHLAASQSRAKRRILSHVHLF